MLAHNRILALVSAGLLAVVATADTKLNAASDDFTYTNCASGGSAAQTITVGRYLVRTFDEEVYVCLAATCASGGHRFAAGTILAGDDALLVEADTSVSCRSASSTGDISLSKMKSR